MEMFCLTGSMGVETGDSEPDERVHFQAQLEEILRAPNSYAGMRSCFYRP